jgi:hypothetical protein
MMNAVAEKLRAAGVEVVTYTDTVSTSQGENLDRIVDFHNAQTRDLDVSIHLNAFDHSAHGVEVLYLTQSSLASKVSAAIAEAGGFTNRGGKKRTDLAFLNGTEEPAILLECWFCDHTGDCQSADAKHDAIAEAIAESISGVQVPDEQPPDVEEPPPDETEPPTEDNRVVVRSRIRGDVTVIVNDTVVHGERRCANIVDLRVDLEGDVVVVVNGEEFHNKPEEPEEPEPGEPPGEPQTMHTEIFATTFGGSEDGEYSAYGPYDSQGRGPYLNDTEYYVALPMRINEQPRVKVWNRATGRSGVGRLMDIGPWCTNDPYWTTGSRPAAETSYNNKTPLPADSGTHAGEIAGNPAGIDLSPALFEALGMRDNGPVDWCFEEDAPEA